VTAPPSGAGALDDAPLDGDEDGDGEVDGVAVGAVEACAAALGAPGPASAAETIDRIFP
jgi:hypothetical protein